MAGAKNSSPQTSNIIQNVTQSLRQTPVNLVIKLGVPYKAGNLSARRAVSFSRKNVLHGISLLGTALQWLTML